MRSTRFRRCGCCFFRPKYLLEIRDRRIFGIFCLFAVRGAPAAVLHQLSDERQPVPYADDPFRYDGSLGRLQPESDVADMASVRFGLCSTRCVMPACSTCRSRFWPSGPCRPARSGPAWGTSALPVLVFGLLYMSAKRTYMQQTGVDTFSAFSGWQLLQQCFGADSGSQSGARAGKFRVAGFTDAACVHADLSRLGVQRAGICSKHFACGITSCLTNISCFMW